MFKKPFITAHFLISGIFSIIKFAIFSPASTGEQRISFTKGKTSKVKSPSTSFRVA